MGSIFSKGKHPSRVTQQDEAILFVDRGTLIQELKVQRDKLKQYQRKIETSLDREREIAKQLIAKGQKDRALLLLKKKRYREKLIEQTLGQLTKLEQMVHDIEFAQIEVNVVSSLKQGNEALTRMHRLMSVDDVEKILEETREAVEYQHEIDSIISGELNDTDIAEVEAELDALLAGETPQAIKLPSVPKEEPQAEPQLPDVPSSEPSAKRPAVSKQKREKEVELVSA